MLQVDILHPLATLHWKECAPLPFRVPGIAECVVCNDKIYIGGRAYLFLTSTDLTSWRRLTLPVHNSAITTYHSKLTLVGGRVIDSGEITNRLWTSDTGSNLQSSLPPMPTKRYLPSAINTGDPEYLVVAGGRGVSLDILDTVEVLAEEQWLTVQPLPGRRCYGMKSTLHNGKVYFMGGAEQGCDVYYCKVKDLLSGISWSQLEVPSRGSFPASFGQQLIAFDRNFKVLAHSSLTQSWVRVGKMPCQKLDATPVVLSTGELVVMGYCGQLKTRAYRGSLKSECIIVMPGWGEAET